MENMLILKHFPKTNFKYCKIQNKNIRLGKIKKLFYDKNLLIMLINLVQILKQKISDIIRKTINIFFTNMQELVENTKVRMTSLQKQFVDETLLVSPVILGLMSFALKFVSRFFITIINISLKNNFLNPLCNIVNVYLLISTVHR